MANTHRTRHPLVGRTVTAGLLALVALAAGCNSNTTAPAPPPGPSAAPVVRSVTESRGSTGGGAVVKIEGTGFLDGDGGAVVIFGGVYASGVSHSGTSVIFATVPAHAAGLVDVVVSNPDGQSARLADAYTYVSPDSFDPNGEWNGQTGQVIFRFTVENNRLTTVSCGTSGTVSFSPAPLVSNGEFAFSREDGVAIAGRMVTAGYAIGTINLGPVYELRLVREAGVISLIGRHTGV